MDFCRIKAWAGHRSRKNGYKNLGKAIKQAIDQCIHDDRGKTVTVSETIIVNEFLQKDHLLARRSLLQVTIQVYIDYLYTEEK